MKARLKQFVDRVDAMSLRERVLIFAMLAGLLFSLALTGAIDPMTAKQKQLTQRLTETQAQVQALEAQMQALAEAAKIDPDAATKARFADLEEKRKAALDELGGVKQGLIAPDKMAQVLRDLLGKNPRLKLVSIKTLPASALVEAEKPASAKDKAPAPTPEFGLFKHGVEISVEGSYPDLVAYLSELEHLPWRVYWGGANLSVQQYPVSRLTFTVFTLSLDKTWLSV